jgi:hypothetical protein
MWLMYWTESVIKTLPQSLQTRADILNARVFSREVVAISSDKRRRSWRHDDPLIINCFLIGCGLRAAFLWHVRMTRKLYPTWLELSSPKCEGGVSRYASSAIRAVTACGEQGSTLRCRSRDIRSWSVCRCGQVGLEGSARYRHCVDTGALRTV